MNIVFFGTPDFVIPVAESLLSAVDCRLLAVVTNPDRPTGRQQILTPSPIKQWALAHQINVINHDTMIHIIVSLKELNPHLGILAAYGKIIPQELIDFFPQGILVIHPSLLPQYRGASPVQASILNGDKETGVSIIKMDEKMDHGPIVFQFEEPIEETDTAGSLYSRLFQKTAEVLPTILPAWGKGRIIPREQNHAEATYTKLIKKDDGKINWQWPPEKIERFIRAMTPWPGAWTHITLNTKHKTQKLRLKILRASIKQMGVQSSVLSLNEVQLEGKKPVSWQQFQEGYPEVSFS